MKKLISYIIGLLAAFPFVACDEDNGLDPDLEIFQEYEVIVTPEQKAAFANFRIGTAAGPRIALSGGSTLTINALTPYYFETESPTVPEFNYGVYLSPNHQLAKFVFTRSDNMVLTNTVSLENLPRVTIPSGLYTVSNGVPVELELGELDFMKVVVSLVADTSVKEPVVHRAVATPSGFIFRDVPADKYTLFVDYVEVVPTVENDRGASGAITVISRNYKQNVNVN